jgi:outer membrane protein assembly factor BamB
VYHLPTFTANDMFAYAQIGDGGGSDVDPYIPGVPIGFKRDSAGALESLAFNKTLPPVGSIGDYYTLIPTAGESNYLALSLLQAQLPDGETGPIQLGSFIVDSEGNISTTNTWEDMPAPGLVPQILNMSPSGELLAIAGNGLQIFHFNGADPIMPYSEVLTPTVPIDRIHWDKDNHLYALSESQGQLYVYTITPASITGAPGSPYTISAPGANALIVVPK